MKFSTIAAFAAVLSFPNLSHAITCEALQAEIEGKFRAGGIPSVTLLIVGPNDVAPDKVAVGTCENGSKRIVRLLGSTRASGERPSRITTECKEGFAGPDCKQRAPALKQ